MRCAVALVLLAPAAAFGAFFQNASGLASPQSTITFDEHVLARSTLVSTQYADLGLTFNPALYYDAIVNDFATVQGHRLGNSVSGDVRDPFSIFFSSPVSAAALGVASNSSNTTFTALLAGQVVESAVATTNTTTPDAFYGFSGIVFDQIRISQQVLFGTAGVLIDNIQSSPVPAPSALALPLLAAGFVRRRRA